MGRAGVLHRPAASGVPTEGRDFDVEFTSATDGFHFWQFKQARRGMFSIVDGVKVLGVELETVCGDFDPPVHLDRAC